MRSCSSLGQEQQLLLIEADGADHRYDLLTGDSSTVPLVGISITLHSHFQIWHLCLPTVNDSEIWMLFIRHRLYEEGQTLWDAPDEVIL